MSITGGTLLFAGGAALLAITVSQMPGERGFDPSAVVSTGKGPMPATATLNLSLTLMTSSKLEQKFTLVGPGAWRVDAVATLSGEKPEDGKTSVQTRSFLVFQDGPLPVFALVFDGDHITPADTMSEMIVLDWPTKTRDLNRALAMNKRKAKPWVK